MFDYLYAALPLGVRNKLKRVLMFLLNRKLKNFYQQFISQDSLVFDIGANDGDYSEIFSSLGARVLAIEPQPTLIKSLREKFKNNKNITIVPKGVGNKNGTLDFYISSFNNPNSTFSKEFITSSRYNYRKWDKKIPIPVVTLHSLIKEYGVPDFCKIDVEGYEYEILSAVTQPLPHLSFEFITEMNERTIKTIEHLETLKKYRYNICLGMSYQFIFKKWISAKELISFLQENNAKKLQGDIYAR